MRKVRNSELLRFRRQTGDATGEDGRLPQSDRCGQGRTARRGAGPLHLPRYGLRADTAVAQAENRGARLRPRGPIIRRGPARTGLPGALVPERMSYRYERLHPRFRRKGAPALFIDPDLQPPLHARPTGPFGRMDHLRLGPRFPCQRQGMGGPCGRGDCETLCRKCRRTEEGL